MPHDKHTPSKVSDTVMEPPDESSEAIPQSPLEERSTRVLTERPCRVVSCSRKTKHMMESVSARYTPRQHALTPSHHTTTHGTAQRSRKRTVLRHAVCSA